MKLTSTTRRVGVAAVTAGLALSTAGIAATSSPAMAATTTARTLRATTADGSRILVEVPANWNGTLALYSHGYRSPIDGATTAQDASTPGTASALLARGYALAGSSFPRNGWDVAEGVHADELLLGWFRNHVASPKRVYVWGDSLGGLVTETFAERHPSLITASAPMCGVLAGANMNLDEALDVAVAVKALLYPKLKLRGFSSYADAGANFDAVMTKIENGLGSSDLATQARFATRVLAVADLADAPRKTQHFDGIGLTNAVGAAVEGIGNAMFYGTIGRYDIERRVGADPSTNLGVDYRDRVNAYDVAAWQALGLSEGLLRSYASTVQYFGTRLAAHATARARFAALGTPTGAIGKPTVTLHTVDDPLVLVQNERVFAHRVATHGQSGRLLQVYVAPPRHYTSNPGAPYGAGHCNFTDGDRVALVRTLDAWVDHGAKPSWTTVTGLFPTTVAGQGGLVASTWQPPAWPAR